MSYCSCGIGVSDDKKNIAKIEENNNKEDAKDDILEDEKEEPID